MEYYLTLRKNKLLVLSTTWTNHTGVMLGFKKIQTQEYTVYIQQLAKCVNGDRSQNGPYCGRVGNEWKEAQRKLLEC